MPKANEAKKAKAVSKEDIKETVMEEKPATKAKAPKTAKTANSTKAVITETVCLQYAGREIELSDILAKVKASCEGESAIKDIRVYVKPEENMAYYVVNGDVTGSIVF
jgi:cell envelope opacity-associated protein A